MSFSDLSQPIVRLLPPYLTIYEQIRIAYEFPNWIQREDAKKLYGKIILDKELVCHPSTFTNTTQVFVTEGDIYKSTKHERYNLPIPAAVHTALRALKKFVEDLYDEKDKNEQQQKKMDYYTAHAVISPVPSKTERWLIAGAYPYYEPPTHTDEFVLHLPSNMTVSKDVFYKSIEYGYNIRFHTDILGVIHYKQGTKYRHDVRLLWIRKFFESVCDGTFFEKHIVDHALLTG